MEMMSTDAAREQFEDVIKRAARGKERIVLTRRGKRLVAVVPIEDLDMIEEIEDQIDREEVKKALDEVEREGTIPWEQVKAELGL